MEGTLSHISDFEELLGKAGLTRCCISKELIDIDVAKEQKLWDDRQRREDSGRLSKTGARNVYELCG